MKSDTLKPSIPGPFHVEQATDCRSGLDIFVIATSNALVYEVGLEIFGGIAQCNNRDDAEFIADACNKAVYGWKEIETHQPPKQGYYLCACSSGYVGTSFYDPTKNLMKLGLGRKYYGKFGRFFDLSQHGHQVTHWMEKPPHPNEQA